MLDSGLAAFAERGYAQTTIDELVERCGCARATFYAYFPDGKDGLFRAIYEDISATFEEAFLAGVSDNQTDVIACVDVAARALVEICQEPGKGRFFMIEAPALPHVLGPALGKGSRTMVHQFSARIVADQQQGLLNEAVSPPAASLLLVGMIRELGMRVAMDNSVPADLLAALQVVLSGALAL